LIFDFGFLNWEEVLAAVRVDLRLVLSIKNQSSKIKNRISNGRVKKRMYWIAWKLAGALAGMIFES
jgi:hypothetical protein